MSSDPNDAPKSDDIDPAEMQNALGRTGRMLKTAGLPFEMDEFEDSELEDAPKDPAPEQDGTSADGGGSSSDA